MKIIAVDFDGTLCKNCYPDIGTPNQHTIDYVLKEQERGAKIILWTCRVGLRLDEAIEWCKYHGLWFDAINANVPDVIARFGGDSRKIYADEYLDDKCILVGALEIKRNMFREDWL